MSLQLCVPKKKSCVTRTHLLARFFLTRITRMIRNCHPAHLDTTDHRFAMVGWNGKCLPFLYSSSGRRPSVFPIPPNSPQAVGPLITQALLSASKMRNSKSSAALRAKNTCVPHTLLCEAQKLRATHLPRHGKYHSLYANPLRRVLLPRRG